MTLRLPVSSISVYLILMVTYGAVMMGCAVPEKRPEKPPPTALERMEQNEVPDFFDDMCFDGLAYGISKSIAYLKRVPADRAFDFAGDTYSATHMIRSLERFARFIETGPSTGQLRRFIAGNYRTYRSVGSGPDGRVLFTGYYEPVLRGYREKKGAYRFPIYARPEDHIELDLSRFSKRFKGESITGRIEGNRFVPYYDREEIDQKGLLAGKARVLAWLADPVDLFFLHIQGSGKVFLEDGERINVHYHATNGRPYRSIGRLLIDKGLISRERMSMQAIRAYLKSHPEQMADIFNYNPSYVFFKPEAEGPLGCLDVKLTPGRSIATDRRLFPPAALSFIQTKKPLVDAENRIHTWTDLHRFVLNQDTGGAIKGPGRVDLFWGTGSYARLAAGHMKHPGAVYFLVLKPDAG